MPSLPRPIHRLRRHHPDEAERRTIVIRSLDGWTSPREHFRNFRDYFDLLYTLSDHRISVRYRLTALGVLWAVIQPLLMMVIFTTVSSYVARMPSDGMPSPPTPLWTMQ